ncbi:bifunctional nuclease domain-containing protein [Myroides odoratus]
MSLIKLTVKGISYSHSQNGAYALILDEEHGDRKLPIVIGAFEAQAIAIAIEEEIRPPRPLTHDLFKSFADTFDIQLKHVIVHKLVDGVFFSSLVWEKNGVEEVMDARTSDAIALAIRFFAPIYTYPDIMNKAGIILSGTPEVEEEDSTEDDIASQVEQFLELDIEGKGYGKYGLPDLQRLLNEAIGNEDYETAARIRDEISKRS